MSQPEHDGGKGQHRQIVDRPLLIPGRDTSELLQAPHQPFDHVPLLVCRLVETTSAPLQFLSRNDAANAAPAQVPPNLPAAVALVSCHALGTEARTPSSR